MKIVNYEKIHTRFLRWRSQFLPNNKNTLCVGSKKYEKGFNIDIDPNNNPDLVANITNVPLPKNSFNDCYMFQVLEHVLEPIRAISEINRVCTGDLYLSVPTIRNSYLIRTPPQDSDNYHKYHLKDSDWETLFRWCGYVPEYKHRFYSFWFSRIWPFDMVCGMHRGFTFWKLKKGTDYQSLYK